MVGRSVVVTDYRANVHVYDVGTGKETRTAKLTDRAKGMCARRPARARVWIEMSDEKNVTLRRRLRHALALRAARVVPAGQRHGRVTVADG